MERIRYYIWYYHSIALEINWIYEMVKISNSRCSRETPSSSSSGANRLEMATNKIDTQRIRPVILISDGGGFDSGRSWENISLHGQE